MASGARELDATTVYFIRSEGGNVLESQVSVVVEVLLERP
jgi:hypothetical protein